MFIFAILIGIYSYTIFFLGIFALLYKEIIIVFTVVFFIILFLFFRKYIYSYVSDWNNQWIKLKKDLVAVSLIGMIMLLAGVYLIGALGPELAFDALWYHLTLPRLFLLNHAIYHIPGGLLYYSDMPKLGELLYIAALAIGNEIGAKVTHWFFGLLTLIVLYKLSRKFFTQAISLLTVVIFYSNLVVAWESTTAYIDLIRTFFEVVALWAFINWWQLKQRKWFVVSAIMTGLAISSKVLALGSIGIFSLLIFWKLRFGVNLFKKLIVYWGIALVIPLPWFLFAFINTGNPIYPIFSDVFSGLNAKVFDNALLNPVQFIHTLWSTFTYASDPLSPIYIIFSPLLFWYFRKADSLIKVVYAYFFIALGLWYSTSQIEGSRLLVSYLPALSIICAGVIAAVHKEKKVFGIYFYRLLIGLVIFTGLITASYRFIANSKYIPVIVGTQSKQEFLTNNLNFHFGDFYDVDGYFAKNIKHTDNVLLYGFHNLYYVKFPYTHSSWVKKGDTFNYIAVQDALLPERFEGLKLIYENKITHVKLYSTGGKVWRY